MTSRRTGFLLLEAIVAAALLAVLLGVSLRVLGATAVQRRGVEKRVVALQEAAGAMERARALAWDELTLERLEEIAISPEAEPILSGASVRWTVEDSTSQPATRHVVVEITWQSPAGPTAPVRLNYWAYAPQGASPGGAP